MKVKVKIKLKWQKEKWKTWMKGKVQNIHAGAAEDFSKVIQSKFYPTGRSESWCTLTNADPNTKAKSNANANTNVKAKAKANSDTMPNAKCTFRYKLIQIHKANTKFKIQDYQTFWRKTQTCLSWVWKPDPVMFFFTKKIYIYVKKRIKI